MIGGENFMQQAQPCITLCIITDTHINLAKATASAVLLLLHVLGCDIERFLQPLHRSMEFLKCMYAGITAYSMNLSPSSVSTATTRKFPKPLFLKFYDVEYWAEHVRATKFLSNGIISPVLWRRNALLLVWIWFALMRWGTWARDIWLAIYCWLSF